MPTVSPPVVVLDLSPGIKDASASAASDADQPDGGVSGLTAGTIYDVRVRALTRQGEQSWSQLVSVMVA